MEPSALMRAVPVHALACFRMGEEENNPKQRRVSKTATTVLLIIPPPSFHPPWNT
jgi:hypothetical protein